MKCPKCNGEMIKYGTVRRYVKGPGGIKQLVIIQRYHCKKCNLTMRDLPDGMVAFKHYTKQIISGVKDGSITGDTLEYEDYPCEMTMKRWKNETHAY